jgi:D-lactate dehydrogenase
VEGPQGTAALRGRRAGAGHHGAHRGCGLSHQPPGPATLDLQNLFDRHGYREAIIFGHALAGNLHFVFSPDFGEPTEVDRYARFMDDIARMVVDDYDGSLKAEHGTGRNMAPFVEKEWGSDAYGLMQEIKAIFDPDGCSIPV